MCLCKCSEKGVGTGTGPSKVCFSLLQASLSFSTLLDNVSAESCKVKS